MDEAVHGGEGHGGTWEDPAPIAKGLVAFRKMLAMPVITITGALASMVRLGMG